MGEILIGSKKIYKNKQEFLKWCLETYENSPEYKSKCTLENIIEKKSVFDSSMPSGLDVEVLGKNVSGFYIFKIRDI